MILNKLSVRNSFLILLSCFFLSTKPAIGMEQTIKKRTQFILLDYLWRHDNAKDVSSYMDFVKSQGYTGVAMQAMDRQNNFYFNSPYLKKMKWIEQPNLLTLFLKEWDEKNKLLGDEGLNFSIDMTPLSERQNYEDNIFMNLYKKIKPDRFEEFFIDLQASYKFESIATEPFHWNIQSKLSKIVSPASRKVNLILETSSFENLLRGKNFSETKFEKLFDRITSNDSKVYPLSRDFEDNLPTIGLGDFGFALGRTFKKETWAGVASGKGPISEHNLFLYRTAQYSPQGYLMIPEDINSPIYDSKTWNFEKNIKEDVARFYTVSKSDQKKPVANLVIASFGKPFREPYLSQFIEPITNAILANGYDIQVTFGSFYKKADLYYVIAMDGNPEKDFMDELLKLMNLKRSRFYGTVILHPMTEIRDKGRWKKVREFFHIPKTEKGWISNLPSYVGIGGHKYAWKGTVNGNSYGMSFIRESAVRASEGEVTLPEVFQNNTLSLIIKSGNHYLINGNFLHLEASFFLSQLMGNALQTPFTGYVTVNRSCVAALAIDDSLLKIKMPFSETSDQWKMSVFNDRGGLVQSSIIKKEAVFEKSLNARNLLILETK